MSKLLKWFELDDRKLISALRSDLWAERRKADGLGNEGGGDFHGPFWADAKQHVCGIADLKTRISARIDASPQRKRLYPALGTGFLAWFDEVRRGTNLQVGVEPISAHNRREFEELDLRLKVDNLLCLKIGLNDHRLVYPYWSEKPFLIEKWARVGLWAMAEVLEDYTHADMEILDVLRSRSFRGLRIFLKGDEEALFVNRYYKIREQELKLRPEYGLK